MGNSESSSAPAPNWCDLYQLEFEDGSTVELASVQTPPIDASPEEIEAARVHLKKKNASGCPNFSLDQKIKISGEQSTIPVIEIARFVDQWTENDVLLQPDKFRRTLSTPNRWVSVSELLESTGITIKNNR